ncbi:hypothetical protein NLU13_2773 [Sarocladium strictum]|uniref:BZIP domain-containing protein n=1 Tax=Sarocladium strictum TaxID=5046 RepID=A0AA39GKR9_SARSR|nr:hypothetical protein NLU13_2773 [Sarocladium strictum]
MSQSGAASSQPPRPHSPSFIPNISPEGLRPEAAVASTGVGSTRADSSVSAENHKEETHGYRSRSTIGAVLNPAEQHSSSTERRTPPPIGPAAAQGPGQTLTPAGPLKIAPFAHVQHAGPDHFVGRGAPTPMPDGSRKILSPRGPRAASASYAHPQFTGSPHLTAGPEAPSNYPQDASVALPRPQVNQLPPISSATSLPGTPIVSASQPVRTNSQPSLGPSHPIAPAAFASAAHRRPWPASTQPSQHHTVADGPSGFPRSASVSGLTSPAGWQNLLRDRQGLASSEGNEVITGRLPDGSEIPLTIDITTGSARQSQKRSRNAEASGRHRSKRKAQTSDMQKEIESLKEERESSQQRMNELARERDFYREERNRLRDLVSRTPQISHLAHGPPSPETSRAHDHTTGAAVGAPGTSETSSTEHRRQLQGYPAPHTTSEVHGEILAHQSETDMHGAAQQSGYHRPPIPHEPSRGPAGNVTAGASEQRPLGAGRTSSAPQLPPIGAVGNSLGHLRAHIQPWDSDRLQDQWNQVHGRHKPGWSTGRPDTPDAPR